MLSLSDANLAADLRELLDSGTLARRGRVSFGHGSVVRFDTAVSVTLADLDHLRFLERCGDAIDPDRWHRLRHQLADLHRRVVAPLR